LAAVVQHETDHLGGKLYLDRMPDLTTLTYLKEYRHHVDAEDTSEDELAPS
jgi:peptide deformylase